MPKKQAYKVAALGFTEAELRMLKSLELIQAGRSRPYEFDAQAGTEVDIYIVNGEDVGAMREWSGLRGGGSAPAMVVSAAGDVAYGHRGFKRPLIASRVLGMLDDIIGLNAIRQEAAY